MSQIAWKTLPDCERCCVIVLGFHCSQLSTRSAQVNWLLSNSSIVLSTTRHTNNHPTIYLSSWRLRMIGDKTTCWKQLLAILPLKECCANLTVVCCAALLVFWSTDDFSSRLSSCKIVIRGFGSCDWPKEFYDSVLVALASLLNYPPLTWPEKRIIWGISSVVRFYYSPNSSIIIISCWCCWSLFFAALDAHTTATFNSIMMMIMIMVSYVKGLSQNMAWVCICMCACMCVGSC